MSGKKKWTTGCLAKAESQEEYDAVMATVPKTVQPKKLAEFGYKYNDDGRLVQSINGKPFAWLGQKHYDKLGDAIVEEIYTIMRDKYGFKEVQVPLEEAEKGRPSCPIFLSPNWDTAKTVVFLCQGSGAVRPGMWARALCINNSLKEGTIFSYLEECLSNDWGVMVANPNENGVLPPEKLPKGDLTPDQVEQYWLGTPDKDWKALARTRAQNAEPIESSWRPEVHAQLCWDTFIAPKPRPTLIIAHSYGGKCTTALLRTRFELFSTIVAGIALTDAINDLKYRGEKKEHVSFMKAFSLNWVGSKKPLDTPEPPSEAGCTEVSSGHEVHEWTSASCQTSVFPFLKKKLEEFASRPPPHKGG